MNFQEIEKLRSELSTFLPQINGLPKVLVLFSFYEKLLLTKDVNLINAFAPEFIEEYFSELDNYSSFYSEPKRTEQLLKQLSELRLVPIFEIKYSKIDELISSINKKLNYLLSVLDGNVGQTEKSKKLLFPLLGKIVTSSETYTYASIEPVTIRVTTAKHKDSFVFIPSHQKKEQLEEQTKISFQLALQYLNDYKHKFHKYHEVLIYFDNLSADYEGYSLGIALTIGFIEQLSVLYNLPYLTIVKNNIASTGGLDKNGNVYSLGEEIIKQKVETACYSDLETLIIPEADELAAKEKLNELKKKYPERKFNIVEVENLKDLLNRRNLVEIKKQSPIVRTANNIRRNWKATTIVFALLAALIFNFWIDWDDNPAKIYNDEHTLYVKNKSGKTLWTKPQNPIPIWLLQNDRYFKTIQKLVDINGDGVNEIIFANEIPEASKDSKEIGRIVCFDKTGNVIWKYVFNDTVSSQREFLPPPYYSTILDTITMEGQKILIAAAINQYSYSSAIYCLDLRTGKRVTGTLWNSGFIRDGFIDDLYKDGKRKIVFSFCNNGYERCGTSIVDLTELTGTKVLPTTPNYLIKDFPLAKTERYLLYPNSDYTKYLQLRYSSTLYGFLWRQEKDNVIVQYVFQDKDKAFIIFKLSYDLKDINVIIGDDFKASRDGLVKLGKLEGPLSDTPEYINTLKSQILYWNGITFVKRETFR